MALAYRPPDVRITEEVSPSISPLLAVPASMCLIGVSQGYQTRTDQFNLTGTSPIRLPGLAASESLQSVQTVKDALDPSKGASDGSGYVVTTDYTINLNNGTISRVGTGDITDGAIVNVTYRYVPDNYYDAIRLDNFSSVEERFGRSLNDTGSDIGSVLSYAAGIAFENGAADIVFQPLFIRDTPGDTNTPKTQPTNTEAASVNSWQDTLRSIRDIEDINILIPVVGQDSFVNDAAQLGIEQSVQDHIQFLRTQQQYAVGLFGEDGTKGSFASKTTLRNHASVLRGRYGGVLAEQLAIVSPSQYVRPLPGIAETLLVGGQYVAAGVGGMICARPTHDALTGKVLAGFLGVKEFRELSDKNIDASNGLMVIEQKGGVVQVRHGVTLDNTVTARRELSVVRAKHRMIESLRDTISRQIIGNIIADDNAPIFVRATVIGVLEALRVERDLVDYSNVEARLTSLDPTLVQVRFSYRPAFPLNYVDIVFSINLNTGTLTTNPTGQPTT